MKNVHELLNEMQANEDVDVLREMVEVIARAVMEAQVSEHLGAERHERSEGRRGHRNGYKLRKINTRVGRLVLEVSQVRGVEPYSPLLFAKWQRSERALLVACAEMYFMGVSTRKVKHVLEKMGGFEMSAGTVSRVAQELDEKIEEFRARRLDEHLWPWLVVDACYVKVRRNGNVHKQAVLVGGGHQRGRPPPHPDLACGRRGKRGYMDRGLPRVAPAGRARCPMGCLRRAPRYSERCSHPVAWGGLAALLDAFYAQCARQGASPAQRGAGQGVVRRTHV